MILAVTGLGSAARAGQPIDTPPGPPSPRDSSATRSPALFGRADLWYGLASGAVLTVAAFNDRWLTQETIESQSRGEHDIARTAQPLGNVAVVVPALAAAYGAGRLMRWPSFTDAAKRTGVSVAVAGTFAFALKEITGRARPNESPDDAWHLRPFSGNESFPSGHATVAFALATALDRETSSRWVPWLAYPAAAAVGWSRVHDDQHWTSDVFAGAALGIWTAAKVDRVMRARDAARASIGFFVRPAAGESRIGLCARF